MSLRLHKEFGVNPTIPACIICHKDKNEIALLGASYKGEAPMSMVTSLEPCDDCREAYLKGGVMLAEATPDEKQPTGNIIIITTEAFQRIFTVPIPPKHICLLEDVAFQRIAQEVKQAETPVRRGLLVDQHRRG